MTIHVLSVQLGIGILYLSMDPIGMLESNNSYLKFTCGLQHSLPLDVYNGYAGTQLLTQFEFEVYSHLLAVSTFGWIQ